MSGISLHEQSHGESFMALVENRFFGNGLYILDEPGKRLYPLMRLMELMCYIKKRWMRKISVYNFYTLLFDDILN